MSTMPAKPGDVGPILPAIAGMFVVSVLDVVGIVSTGSTLGLAVNYGLFGACGGMLIYALARWLRRRNGMRSGPTVSLPYNPRRHDR